MNIRKADSKGRLTFSVHILKRRLDILGAIILRELRIEPCVRWLVEKLDRFDREIKEAE